MYVMVLVSDLRILNSKCFIYSIAKMCNTFSTLLNLIVKNIPLCFVIGFWLFFAFMDSDSADSFVIPIQLLKSL